MITALLVRYGAGWAEVRNDTAIAAHGRREALLGIGAVSSLPEVQRIGGEQLAIFARRRSEITVGLMPASNADEPYAAFREGDTVLVPDEDGTMASERVLAITGAEDDNGQVTFAPEIKDSLLIAAERWEQALKKMADGTIRGQSPVATPASQIGNTTTNVMPVGPAVATGGGGDGSGSPFVATGWVTSVPYDTSVALGMPQGSQASPGMEGALTDWAVNYSGLVSCVLQRDGWYEATVTWLLSSVSSDLADPYFQASFVVSGRSIQCDVPMRMNNIGNLFSATVFFYAGYGSTMGNGMFHHTIHNAQNAPLQVTTEFLIKPLEYIPTS